MSTLAIVFGYSDKGLSLSKQLLLSFYRNIYQDSSVVDVYSYLCNFEITDFASFRPGLEQQDKECDPNSYRYKESDNPDSANDFKDLHFWPGAIYPQNCTKSSFLKFYLPDVAVYHDFVSQSMSSYDYVLFCHNDIKFVKNNNALNEWMQILSDDTRYSIIVEPRFICSQDISARFHMCFVLVNTKKFLESKLSFINDLTLMDGSRFKVYSNGGSGLLASCYSKENQTNFQPYLLDVHGFFRNHETKPSKWFDHIGGVEWKNNPAIWKKQHYLDYISHNLDQAEQYAKLSLSSLKRCPKIEVKTQHPIALESRDHLLPFGTKQDNSVNLKFNEKLSKIMPSPISVLDLGCAGGGMVKSFLDQGDLAVGIEGSDYSFVEQRAEWTNIPNNLFLADITKPFEILIDNHPAKFDLITAWEFFEHIQEKDLIAVFDNIDKHLKSDGLMIASISSLESYHHRTVHPKNWWLEFVKQYTSFIYRADYLDNFNETDFVRNLSHNFHVVLSR